MRWHAHFGSAGTGHLYQGRFKAFPVEDDEHFYTVTRYVERNALRAGLVDRAEEWRWSSLWRRESGDAQSRRCGAGRWRVRATGSNWSTRRRPKRNLTPCVQRSDAAVRSAAMRGNAASQSDSTLNQRCGRGRPKRQPSTS